MVEYNYPAETLEDTARLASCLARVLEAGDVLALTGDLGAGKTTLTRHLARSLGVPESIPVTSPTFTLQNLYEGARLSICHVDLYRLSDGSELSGLGAEEWLDDEALLIVEWADKAPEAVGADYLEVRIQVAPDGGRNFRFRPTGPAATDLVAALQAAIKEALC
jgi:tRNA threonylcarbamoyl adenosine modification protein YjeE